MTATANLTTANLMVEPGQAVRCPLLVRNNGTIVDQFTFEALGPLTPWIRVEPPMVSLFPGAEETVQVCIEPPRSPAVSAGVVPFGIKVVSREVPTDTVVEEGVIDVGGYIDAAVELIPRTARGTTHARYELALDNRGNMPMNGRLAAVDDDNALRYAFHPPAVLVPPGEALFSRITVHPKRAFLTGPSRTHQFRILAEADGHPSLAADGTFIQEARIPGWVPKALAAAVAAAVALVALWFGLVRPKVRSEARQAAAQQVQSDVTKQVATGVASALAAQGVTNGAGAASSAGGGSGSPKSGATGGPSTTAALGAPRTVAAVSSLPPGPVVDGRLTMPAPTAFVVPGGKTFQVTDLIFENPKGDTGTLSVRRSGTPLMVIALDNFRDLDYHFVTPVVIPSGGQLQLEAACTSADCTPALYYVGYTLPAPPAP